MNRKIATTLCSLSLLLLFICTLLSQDTLTGKSSRIIIEGPVSEKEKNDSLMILKGEQDARLNYFHKGPEYGVFGATALSLPCGLVSAVISASKPPANVNLGYPKAHLMLNEAYKLGYTTKAHEIKKRNVWMGFGEGALASVIIAIVFYALQHN